MAARIVDLTKPDDDGTLYASVEEAKQALASMVVKFTSLGYIITGRQLSDADYPQYRVIDQNDAWLGTYTIIVV